MDDDHRRISRNITVQILHEYPAKGILTEIADRRTDSADRDHSADNTHRAARYSGKTANRRSGEGFPTGRDIATKKP